VKSLSTRHPLPSGLLDAAPVALVYQIERGVCPEAASHSAAVSMLHFRRGSVFSMGTLPALIQTKSNLGFHACFVPAPSSHDRQTSRQSDGASVPVFVILIGGRNDAAKKFCDFPAFFFDFSNDRGFIHRLDPKTCTGHSLKHSPQPTHLSFVQNNSALMESDGDGIRWAQIFAVLALYATIRPFKHLCRRIAIE
jgi:hypothetical protein